MATSSSSHHGRSIIVLLVILATIASIWGVWVSLAMLEVIKFQHDWNLKHCKHNARQLHNRRNIQEDLSSPWILPLDESKHALIDSKHLSLKHLYDKKDTHTSILQCLHRVLPKWAKKQESMDASRVTSISTTTSTKRMRAIEDYSMLDMLGAGGFGSVRLAVLNTDPKKKYVIKRVPKHKIQSHRWMNIYREGSGLKSDASMSRVSLPVEASILLYLRSLPPSLSKELIIRLEEYLEDQSYYYLVFEWLPNAVDLTHFFGAAHMHPGYEKPHKLPFGEVRKLFFLITRSILFLHDHNIVHGDIKDENILLYHSPIPKYKGKKRIVRNSASHDQNSVSVRQLESGLQVKLIDFGSCAYVARDPKHPHLIHEYRGGSKYKSPEILMDQIPFDGFKQDVWSLGILFYFMIYGKFPFTNATELLQSQIQFPRHPFLTLELHDLMLLLLHRNPYKRITIKQALNHSFFHGLTL
jgi:protein-serine/threonine kinase